MSYGPPEAAARTGSPSPGCGSGCTAGGIALWPERTDSFPWDRYHTVIDIGSAEGCAPAQLALRHPHLTGGGFDLPAAGPTFNRVS